MTDRRTKRLQTQIGVRFILSEERIDRINAKLLSSKFYSIQNP